jgi:hypothetical protein
VGGVEYTRHCCHYWPIVPAQGDYAGEIGGMIDRGDRSTRRNPAPMPLGPPQTPVCPDANPDRRGGKPATNRLSYGTALSVLALDRPATVIGFMVYLHSPIILHGVVLN